MLNKLKKNLKQFKGHLPVSIVYLLAVSSILIFVNYYTIRVNSSIRAYINGESMYSKGQKDAARYLSEYIYSSDTTLIRLFNNAISVPKYLGLARDNMERGGDDELTSRYWIKGNIHPGDVENMTWFFNILSDKAIFQDSYRSWQKADVLIFKLDSLAGYIFSLSDFDTISKGEVNNYIYQIRELNDDLSAHQLTFSMALGIASRKAENYLLYFNFTVILIMLVVSLFSVYSLIKRIIRKNENLRILNKELDSFVYSASHDLRAPISSMKGILNLFNREKVTSDVRNYLGMMKNILEKQEIFLKEMINYSRNKRLISEKKLIVSDDLIEQVISSHKFIEEARNITFEKKITLEKFYGDETRILIILNNLISNAVKYSDPTEENPFIKISLLLETDNVLIEVEDNGIGIEKEMHEKVFDMFFVTENNNKGSGLGLYIVANTVKKIQGTIHLESEKDQGTIFRVKFPYNPV